MKASCPGVSKNTTFSPFTITSEAPICWVIPPASLEVTLVFLIASSKEVLPWSTCPITVTTGGLFTKSSSLSSSISIKASIASNSSSSLAEPSTNSNPYSLATNEPISKLISWFIVAIVPIFISFIIISDADLSNLVANSWTVNFPSIAIVFPLAAAISSFNISSTNSTSSSSSSESLSTAFISNSFNLANTSSLDIFNSFAIWYTLVFDTRSPPIIFFVFPLIPISYWQNSHL